MFVTKDLFNFNEIMKRQTYMLTQLSISNIISGIQKVALKVMKSIVSDNLYLLKCCIINSYCYSYFFTYKMLSLHFVTLKIIMFKNTVLLTIISI